MTYTNQSAFNKSFKHLMRDGFYKSKPPKLYKCVYAGPNGNSCAVGVLLPRELAVKLDRLRDPGWNNVSKSETKCAIEAQKILSKVDVGLLVELQNIHDLSHTRERRLSALRECAKRFKLKTPTFNSKAVDALLPGNVDGYE
jgi:hypothetical protein